MRAGGEIGEIFLMAKISAYTVFCGLFNVHVHDAIWRLSAVIGYL